MLNQALTKAGYSPRKTLKYLADNDIITSTTKKNGGKEYCIRRWFDNRTCRFVEFDLGRFTNTVDPLNEDEAAEAAGITPKNNSDEWKSIPEGESTPFEQENLQLPF